MDSFIEFLDSVLSNGTQSELHQLNSNISESSNRTLRSLLDHLATPVPGVKESLRSAYFYYIAGLLDHPCHRHKYPLQKTRH